MCESYAVCLRLAVNVLVVLYSARLTVSNEQRTTHT